MKNTKSTLIIIVVLVVLFMLLKPYFIITEGKQAVVTRFGKIVNTVSDAGFHFKTPMIDNVVTFPKKIQSWDGDAERFPTQENQFIWVDATARWKITDLKLFYESVGSIPQAHSRLDDVIDSSVRKIISRNLLREAIRNSNVINEIKRSDAFSNQQGGKLSKAAEEKKNIRVTSTFTDTKYEEITKGRQKLSDEMLAEARTTTPKYGIELIDIVIRQIKYSDDLTKSVHNRMIKERNQVAQAFRSDGEGEKANWLGKMEKELRSIKSEAERKAKEIKAKADGEALEIRNKAYARDPEFAEFYMALTQYQELLPKMEKILTTDFEYFKYLYNKLGR
jgi:membrane protease subunit HflC